MTHPFTSEAEELAAFPQPDRAQVSSDIASMVVAQDEMWPGRIGPSEAYYAMRKPRPQAEVEAAADAFFDEVRGLRRKHGLADVYVTIGHDVTELDGKFYCASTHIGNNVMAARLAGAAYEREHDSIFGRQDPGRERLSTTMVKQEIELWTMRHNLTATQERCTEQQLEIRDLREKLLASHEKTTELKAQLRSKVQPASTARDAILVDG